MDIAGWVRASTVDYPGQIAAVLFMPGCNLDCFYCHNRTLLQPGTPLLDLEQILAFLRKRRGLLDGVVLSGGEPLLQPDLLEFIRQLKQLSYLIKLDTNGTMPDCLADLLREKLVDYLAVDYKAPWRRYPEICGCQPETAAAVRSTLELLLRSDLAWEVRTTVAAQLSAADLEEMAAAMPPLPAFYLQICRKPAVFKPTDRFRLETAGYTAADLLRLADAMRPWQPNVRVRL